MVTVYLPSSRSVQSKFMLALREMCVVISVKSSFIAEV